MKQLALSGSRNSGVGPLGDGCFSKVDESGIMLRQKTVGRQVGTPNRRTATIEAGALGCDPIEGMAKIATDESQPVALRFAAMKELAPYVAAKRKAVEVSGPEGSPMPLAASIMTPEEFEEIARRIAREI